MRKTADKSRIPLYGIENLIGWIITGEQSQDGQNATVRLENNTLVRIPWHALIHQPDGSYYLPIRPDQLRSPEKGETVMVIPVIEEEAVITKRQTGGRVNIKKHVHKQDEKVEIPLIHEEVQVERIPINQVVDTPPQVRYEGDTIIIPVLEEQLVVEKRLVLIEEVRVTRKQHQVNETRKVTLRKEAVEIERTDSGGHEERDL